MESFLLFLMIAIALNFLFTPSARKSGSNPPAPDRGRRPPPSPNPPRPYK